MRRHARLGLFAVAAMVLACDDQGPRTPSDVVLTPNLPRVPMGGTLQLTATVVDADGRAVEGEPVTFASSDLSVLTVGDDGLLMSVGPLGISVVSAASGDLTAQVEAEVVIGPSALYVTPASLELTSGEFGGLNWTVTDENGDSIPQPLVLFQTSDPLIVDVTDGGSVRGGEPGTATITVTSGDDSQDIPVTVSAP
jgi:uncharacterized protein YjdB